MPRFNRPHVASGARNLTLQTAKAARRAKWELLALVPLLLATIVAYEERERIFGVDTPVRIAAALVMVALGWALARDLGRFSAPALFRRMDPATAGTVGFLIRLAFLVAAAIAALRVAGLNPRTLAVGGAITAVVIGLAALVALPAEVTYHAVVDGLGVGLGGASLDNVKKQSADVPMEREVLR